MFHPSDHDAPLSEEEFRLLRDFVHERYGLYFEDGQRASLRARLAGRLASLALGSYEDYHRYLRFSPNRADELRRMVSHLTNNETYFFREQPQLHVFAEHVLRALKERKAEGHRRLRVLSAGCSSGEEPYTLAMILYDSGQFFWNWDARVIGMDVDEAVLDKARRGVFHPNSFRGVSPALIDRHFLRQGGVARVKDALSRLVDLRHGNIVDPSVFAALEPVDVIFCRNVLIYFSDAMTRRAVNHFYDALVPGGYLFLGHAESLSRVTDRFAPIRFQGAMVYQKPESPGAAEESA